MPRFIDLRSDDVGGIIVAAGSAQRMGGVDKCLSMLGTAPIVAWSVQTLEQWTAVSHIVIVVRPDQLGELQRLRSNSGWTKVRAVVPGGARRQDSVQSGLAVLPDTQWVVIHDGARPFAPLDLFQQCLEASLDAGVAVAATPVTDTIKLVRDGVVVRTLDRSELWGVQTPQVFRRDLLTDALSYAAKENLSVTDESTLVERLGVRVKIVLAPRDNIKITTPDDLTLASWLASRRTGI